MPCEPAVAPEPGAVTAVVTGGYPPWPPRFPRFPRPRSPRPAGVAAARALMASVQERKATVRENISKSVCESGVWVGAEVLGRCSGLERCERREDAGA